MSVERYRQILTLARQADAGLYSWLAEGLAAIQDGDDIARALKLPAPHNTGQRNRLLAEAAEIVAPYQTPYKQAETLLKVVARTQVMRDNSKVSRLIRDAALYKAIPTSKNGMTQAIATAKPVK